jgi:hemolysin activation/secretion protein
MLAQIYAAKGYLATVRILQQDVSDGIVNFTIVEARFGKANIDYADTDSTQIQQGVIESIVARQAQQGELVEYAQVDRALLLANDRAGYDVVGGLVPGDENQQTALSLRVAPKQRFSGVLNLDNHGSRATGNERAILSTQFASPTGVGDRLSVNALVTQGVRYAGLSYTRPIGFDGLTYTLDASHTDYRIVEADDAAQKSEGNSTTIGASLRYPLVRGRSQNLFANAGLNRTLLSSEDSTNIESKYKVHSAVFSLYGNFWDQFFKGASTTYHVDVTRGYVDIDKDSLKYTADQAGPETAGNYAKLAMGLQRSETLDAASTLTFSLEGQLASKNLDSAEKLYLGGPNGVRAYPNSEGGGSEGLSASLELERKLNEMISGFVFYDWGRIRQYKFNTAPAADPNLYTLEGVGFGFKGRFANDISWNATLAHRTNTNPNPTLTGDDQDGTKRENRFWMSLSLPF